MQNRRTLCRHLKTLLPVNVERWHHARASERGACMRWFDIPHFPLIRANALAALLNISRHSTRFGGSDTSHSARMPTTRPARPIAAVRPPTACSR